jgi:hypothetical protein
MTYLPFCQFRFETNFGSKAHLVGHFIRIGRDISLLKFGTPVVATRSLKHVVRPAASWYPKLKSGTQNGTASRAGIPLGAGDE